MGWDPPRLILVPCAVFQGHEEPRLDYNHLSPSNASALFHIQTHVLHTLLVT